MATQLSPELLAQLKAYYAQPQRGAMDDPSTGRGAVFTDPATGVQYVQGGGQMNEPGYSVAHQWDGSGRIPGSLFDGTTGAYRRETSFDPPDKVARFMETALPLALLGGMGYLAAPGLMAGGAGELGGAADFTMGGAGGAAAFTPATAAEMGSMGLGGLGELSGAAGTGSLLGGAGGDTLAEAAPGVFNPAADSQLANEAIGGNALSGYTAAGIPSVTVNGAPSGGFMDSIFGHSGTNTLSGLPSWAGTAASLAGGLLGSKGTSGTQSATHELPAYLQGPVGQDLIPRTQGLLNSQMPGAQAAGAQMMSVGSGLLGQTAPTTATNPYLKSIADDMQKRTADLLGQNNLAIQGNAVGAGGLGGSRQGVAQGVGAAKAADYLSGQVANLYGNAYAGDQTRLLQQQTLGAGLMGQGLETQFSPLKNTASVYSPFSGFGTQTQTTQQGGGAMGALGGALGTAQLGKSMGWW